MQASRRVQHRPCHVSRASCLRVPCNVCRTPKTRVTGQTARIQAMRAFSGPDIYSALVQEELMLRMVLTRCLRHQRTSRHAAAPTHVPRGRNLKGRYMQVTTSGFPLFNSAVGLLPHDQSGVGRTNHELTHVCDYCMQLPDHQPIA